VGWGRAPHGRRWGCRPTPADAAGRVSAHSAPRLGVPGWQLPASLSRRLAISLTLLAPSRVTPPPPPMCCSLKRAWRRGRADRHTGRGTAQAAYLLSFSGPPRSFPSQRLYRLPPPPPPPPSPSPWWVGGRPPPLSRWWFATPHVVMGVLRCRFPSSHPADSTPQ